jgi:hypothetical protein
MSLIGQVKTVLWSFVGIGGRKRDERDRDNLLVVIAVAVVLVDSFLGTLAFVARHAASLA